jgi:glutathione S-transferase
MPCLYYIIRARHETNRDRMKLLGSVPSPYTRKVRVVLAEKKIECDFETVDVNPPENPVNAHNPLGKVPALVLDDGTTLFDSRVIVEFLDGVSPLARLIPEDNRERVAVRRWEALADGCLDAGLLIRYESLRPKKEQSRAWTDKQSGKLRRGLAAIAAELGERNWCHGDRYTLADIAVGCCLGWVEFRKPGGIVWRGEYPTLERLYERLMERPAFADTAPQ